MKHSPIVINVRGNSGSGKTFLTRELMSESRSIMPLYKPGTTKVTDYKLDLGTQRQWIVLGSYENTCGGCDTIKTQADIIARIRSYSTVQHYNVWLEGLILSTIYGSVGEFSEAFHNRWLFAYLDTPLEVCLDRIDKRRAEAGNDKPLNENNTRTRHPVILRNYENTKARGRRVITLPWQDPLPHLMNIIRKEG